MKIGKALQMKKSAPKRPVDIHVYDLNIDMYLHFVLIALEHRVEEQMRPMYEIWN